MKAMMLKSKNTPLVPENVPDPVPGAGEAVAKVLARGEFSPIVTEKAPLEQAEAIHQRLEKGLVTARAALLMS